MNPLGMQLEEREPEPGASSRVAAPLAPVEMGPLVASLREASVLLSRLAANPERTEAACADLTADVVWRWETREGGFVYVAHPGERLVRWLRNMRTQANVRGA